MSYADDLFDHNPAPQREGFTNYKHWRVIQTAPEGHSTTNWFASRPEAAVFAAGLAFDVGIEGVSCEEFESAWPEDWRTSHIHGGGSDGERPKATEPTPHSDARRSHSVDGVSAPLPEWPPEEADSKWDIHTRPLDPDSAKMEEGYSSGDGV